MGRIWTNQYNESQLLVKPLADAPFNVHLDYVHSALDMAAYYKANNEWFSQSSNEWAETFDPQGKAIMDANASKGGHTIFTGMSIKAKGRALNKFQFQDTLKLNYNLPVETSLQCIYNSAKSPIHSETYKRGGYTIARHNPTRDVLTTYAEKAFGLLNVMKEPLLEPVV